MASRKHKRYGQGGFKHTKSPNRDRRNGKAWKKISRVFDPVRRRLVAA